MENEKVDDIKKPFISELYGNNTPKTLVEFHNDNSFIRGIKGPYGSAKSTAMCMEILYRSSIMPIYGNNTRSSKWAVIRATYPELMGTTIPTWKKVIDPALIKFKMGNREVPSGEMRFVLEDGSIVDLRLEFFALDNPSHVDKLGSFEFTGAWVNEAREISYPIISALTGRVGRYPGVIRDRDGKEISYWNGIIMDTNPPDDDHWWYNFAEVEKPKNWKFFSQPPALMKDIATGDWVENKDAENIDNLTGGYQYYFNQLGGKDDAWIRVYVCGEYGTIAHGKPVFPLFAEKDHIYNGSLDIIENYPIIAGIDPGFNTGLVLAQFTKSGQLRVIDEVYQENITAREFINECLRPLIINKYQGMEINFYSDPAMMTRSNVDGATVFQEYVKAGVNIMPAATNSISARVQAVNSFLVRKNGFIVSTDCHVVIKGLRGEYCYERVMVAQERYRDKPSKNKYSHCFVGSTKIYTPYGMQTIDSMLMGDIVYTPFGTAVVEEIMHRDVNTTLILEFTNGVIIRCTLDHPFITSHGVKKAEELNSDYTLEYSNENTFFIENSMMIRKFKDVKLKSRNIKFEDITVYDIKLNKDHIFYAENIAVHNCQDALQYLALACDPSFATSKKSVKVKKSPKQWGF